MMSSNSGDSAGSMRKAIEDAREAIGTPEAPVEDSVVALTRAHVHPVPPNEGTFLKLAMSPARFFALKHDEPFKAVVTVDVQGYLPSGLENCISNYRTDETMYRATLTKAMLAGLERDSLVKKIEATQARIQAPPKPLFSGLVPTSDAIDSALAEDDGCIPKKLFKTTIVIWSEYDASDAELHDLAFQAEEGDAYCSRQTSVEMTRKQIAADPDWDGTEFFDSGDNDDVEEDNSEDADA